MLRFYILIFFVTILQSSENLALTMKSRGEVNVIKEDIGKSKNLSRGELLVNGDLVMTGDDGGVVLMFLDDKTQLKLKSNSQTKITGTRGKQEIMKRVNLSYGSLKASISEQKGEFIIATGTSVAAVKGTEFWIISNPDSGDLLISISGSVEMTNSYTGETMDVEPGEVVESTPEGEMTVLTTVKFMGNASGSPTGGQFNLTEIELLEGDVESGDISGIVEISDNTIFEGGSISGGTRITITGIFDSETGNTSATLIEAAEPVTVEGIVSSVTGETFTIEEAILISGDTENIPHQIKFNENTTIDGGEITTGAEVTITGNYNLETEILEASEILVVMQELKISGTITSIPSDNTVEITDLDLIEGNVDMSSISGTIDISQSIVDGGELIIGAKVTVTGRVNTDDNSIIATRITVSQISISGVISSGITNNQFTVSNINVTDGDFETSALSGIVMMLENTEIDEERVIPGVSVTITGGLDENTGNISALEVVISEIVITGYVSVVISDMEFDITDISILEGESAISTPSGKVILHEDGQISGGELIVGAKIEVTGLLNVETGDIIGVNVIVYQITVVATVSSELLNDQFEISDISIMEGEADPSQISGVVTLSPETSIEGGELVPGNEVTVTGSLNEDTGELIAVRIIITIRERELIFELENNQGNRKELIIKFQ